MKIGILGTGLMGQPLALRLQEIGQTVVAYNRSPEKLAPLQAAGIEIAASRDRLLEICDCAILFLSDAAAIRATILSEAAKPHLPGCALIQMGTIAPSQSRAILADVAACGGEYLEAPVLGSIPQVKAGTLQIMVGATPEQSDRWSGLLQHLGKPERIGPVGSAAAVKLALNQLIAGLTATFGLSLRFAQQQGVDIEQFMAIVRESALYAPTYDKKLQRMLDDNYANPNFPTKHLLKDVNLFLAEAADADLDARALAGIQGILETALERGLADVDYSALAAALRPPTVD